MFKKISLVFVLIPIIFLSGCTFFWNKPITEIVYQEDKVINTLQEFLNEAQVIADKQIGGGAQLKIVYYTYFDGNFSYDATYAKDGEILKNNIIKNITVSYNKDWEPKKENSVLSHVSKDLVNNRIMAIECNSSIYCATGTANAMADPKNNIDTSKIKIPLSTFLDDKYSTGSNYGFIRNMNGVPIGTFGRFRFNMITGDSFDAANDNISKWYEEQTGSPFNASDMAGISSEEISTSTADVLAQNFNNDLDKDGLTNLQEAGYGTAPGMNDTDEDGNYDGEEINNGYNPLGSGKLISDDCVKNPETNKCYLEIAKAKKDVSICQKISTKKLVFECLFAINLITKNPQICEDLNKAPENDAADFNNQCLTALTQITSLVAQSLDRDVGTIADVKQIQAALEMYYNENGKYPNKVIEGGEIGTFMRVVPSGRKGNTDNCNINYQYKYSFISDNDYSLSYCIDKSLNIDNKKFNLGVNITTPNGIGGHSSSLETQAVSPIQATSISSKPAMSPGSKPLEYSIDDKNIPRIMYWSGKVNQHWDLTKELWLTDPDGDSGSGIDKLVYCKKFYPNAVLVAEYKKETINTWRAGGNSGDYKNTIMSYRCILEN
jgi:hypothetical protein